MISIRIKLKGDHPDAHLAVKTGVVCSVCGNRSELALVFGHYMTEGDTSYDEIVVCDKCAARLLEPMSDTEFEMLLEADL